MITLREFLSAVDFKVTGGSEYCWKCYGDDARFLDSESSVDNGGTYSASIIFDSVTQEVYESTVCDYVESRAYRMSNPGYIDARRQEATERGINDTNAWDDVDFIELEVAEDFLEKTKSIIAGEEYDTRVQIQIDIGDERLFTLMKMAHEQDMTFNQFVEMILRQYCEQHPDKTT